MLFSTSVLFLAVTPNPNRLIFKNVLLIVMLLHRPSLSRLVSGTFFSKDTLFSPSVCSEGMTAGCHTSNCVWLGRTGVLTHPTMHRHIYTDTTDAGSEDDWPHQLLFFCLFTWNIFYSLIFFFFLKAIYTLLWLISLDTFFPAIKNWTRTNKEKKLLIFELHVPPLTITFNKLVPQREGEHRIYGRRSAINITCLCLSRTFRSCKTKSVTSR